MAKCLRLYGDDYIQIGLHEQNRIWYYREYRNTVKEKRLFTPWKVFVHPVREFMSQGFCKTSFHDYLPMLPDEIRKTVQYRNIKI